MKTNRCKVWWIAGCLCGILAGCTEDVKLDTDVKNAKAPDLTAISRYNQTASSVTLTATVENANGYAVTERGFCWGITPLPVAGGNNVVTAGEGSGEFTAIIENLHSDTKYYIRPYAKNKIDTGYGTQIEVNTNDGLGAVRTFVPYNVRAATAVCGGIILFAGEGNVRERGVIVSTSSDLTANRQEVKSVMEADSFICNADNLKPSVTHYVMAYVTNTYGTFYGDTLSFLTTDGRPRMDTVQILNPEYTSAPLFSAILDLGDAPYISRGFYYSESPIPEDTTVIFRLPNLTYGSGGTDLRFVGYLNGLKSQTKYYVRSFAQNKYGWAFSPQAEFYTKSETPTLETRAPSYREDGAVILSAQIVAEGKSALTASGFCYSTTTQEPTLSGSHVSVSPDATGAVRTELSGWRGSATYYIRAYAVNGEGISYGETRILDAPRIFGGGLATFPGGVRMQGSPAYFSVENKGFMVGGDLGPEYTDELWSYDASTNKWQPLLRYLRGNVKWLTTVVYNQNAVFVLGGLRSDYTLRDDFGRYNPSTNMWYSEIPSSDSPSGPDSAFLRLGFRLGDHICFAGGMKEEALKEVWTYHLPTRMWARQTDLPEEQYGGLVVNINDTIYAGLGKNTTGVCNKTLWKSSDLTGWTPEPVAAMLSGGILAGVTLNDKIYVIDEAYYIFEYSPADQVWKRKSRLAENMRDVHCMYVLNGMIHIGLGNINSLVTYNPVWDN